MNTNTCLIKRCRPRRGASAVELSILAPILVPLLLFAIEAGQFFNVWQKISNASREGARVAARNTTTTVAQVEMAVEDYIDDVFPNTPSATLDAALNVQIKDANDQRVTDLTNVTTGSQFSVEVSLRFGDVAWIKGFPVIDNHSATATTVMRRE